MKKLKPRKLNSSLRPKVFQLHTQDACYIKVFTANHPRPFASSLQKVKVKVYQSCPTLCDPMNYTVYGVL